MVEIDAGLKRRLINIRKERATLKSQEKQHFYGVFRVNGV
jgi:hypothetical protein